MGLAKHWLFWCSESLFGILKEFFYWNNLIILCNLNVFILLCISVQSLHKGSSHSIHHVITGKVSSQLPNFVSTEAFPAICLLQNISNNRLIVKLVGIDPIPPLGSGARHNGQQTMAAIFLLDSILLSIQRLQNVCKHGMVFGSVKRSPQMEQVISSSICCYSFSTPPPLTIVLT